MLLELPFLHLLRPPLLLSFAVTKIAFEHWLTSATLTFTQLFAG